MRASRDVLSDLAATGLSVDQIALVMELAASITTEVSSSPSQPERSKAAIRQERYRNRHKTSQNVTSNDVVTECDYETSQVTVGDDNLPLPPSPLLSPQTPQITPHPPTPTCDTRPREEPTFELDLGDGELDDADGGDGDDAQPMAAEKFTLPNWIPKDAWSGYEEMRRRIRKPMTDRARRGIVKKLQKFMDAGHPPGDVLDQSTENSWTGVFELKDNRNGSGNRNTANRFSGTDMRDPVLSDIAYGSNS